MIEQVSFVVKGDVSSRNGGETDCMPINGLAGRAGVAAPGPG